MENKPIRRHNRIKNLVGKKFGRLTVISINDTKCDKKRVYWNCICDCNPNSIRVVSGNQLSSGKTQSCGCLKSERQKESSRRQAQEAKDRMNCKLKHIDAEIIGEYINNVTPVSMRIGKLFISKQLVGLNNMFKTIVKFRDLISFSGDKFIDYSAYSKIGIAIKIETFDGGIIDMKFGDYQRFVKARNEFFLALKNNGHSYSGAYISSSKKVYIDYKCGHTPSLIKPSVYVRGVNCPKCERNNPEQSELEFIELLKNNNHNLLTPYTRNNRKVLIDFNCGHVPHLTTPNNYKRGSRCPYCSESKGETIIRDYLNRNGINNEKEFSIKTNNPIMDIKKYDIYIPLYNLIVEVHGRQHYEEVDFFKNRTLAEEQANDRLKQQYALDNGFNYMVVDYREHIPKLTLNRFIKQLEEFLV